MREKKMKIRKKLLSVLLAAALVLSLPGLTLPALAATSYSINDSSVTISTAGDYIITGSSTASTITVNSDISGDVNITLSDVNITVSSGTAFSVGANTTVNLTLTGTNTLSSGAYCAGLLVPSGAALSITEESTGSLTAIGGLNSSGIGGGGDNNGDAGTVTICGGTVTATGGGYGAGIGGGYNGSGGTVTISGGTVTAIGGGYGAGIRGGVSSIGIGISGGGTVTISGGMVTATGGTKGAGIGGGHYGSGGAIIISGGTVTATGGGYGAGIGGGNDGDGGTVTISGGTVSATGGDYGGGIGGGYYGGGGTVTISGGTVSATGGTNGADIGRSYYSVGSNGNLYISNGSVNASFSGTVYQTSAQTTAVYKTIVSGLPEDTGVTCSYNGGAEFSCATDSNGYLYLWLPTGSGTVSANDGDNYYQAAGTIEGSNNNTLSVTYRLISRSIDLTALSVTGGTLSPSFNRDVAAYSVMPTSGSFSDSIQITATLAYSTSTLTIGGKTATSGVASSVSLNNGANLILVTVTSSDGLSQQSYILSVNGTVSNAELDSLSIGGEAQTVNSSTTDYTYNVGSSVTFVDIKVSPSDSKVIMLLDGAILKSGFPQSVDLSVGENILTLVLVAQDATTKTYTITVNRGTSDATLKTLTLSAGTLSETFDSATYSYTASVSNTVSSLAVTPTANDDGATVTVNGNTASTPVSLSVGENTITVKVTGSDGVTAKTYTVTVTRETAITITTASLPIGIFGASYTKTLSATGGSRKYTWSWAAASGSSLPVNISLSTGGTLSSGGVLTDSDIGEYTVEITATDLSDTAVTQTETFTLDIRKGCGGGAYLIVSDGDSAYTGSYTDDGIPTLTVNTGFTGFTYFGVEISTVTGHVGSEVCVFVQIRNGKQININATKGDFDTLSSATAGFNVKPGDVIEVCLVDSLSNSGNSPRIL
jgi:hypothetical protein